MQTEQTENEIIIRETPSCLWFFGLFFAIVGGIFVYGALKGLADYGSQEIWMLALAFVMGTIGVGVGVRIIYFAPITKIAINRAKDEVVITQYGLFGRQQTIYSFDKIDQFLLIEEKDDEGSPIWFLGLKFIDNEELKISSQASHDEQFVNNFVLQTNVFMGKQLSACELIFELPDENVE